MFRRATFLALPLIGLVSFALGALAPREGRCEQVSPELQRTYDDIQKTLGQVPTFLKRFPAEGLPGAWEAMKSVQLNPHTVLSGKYKELVGLAVSAQIPCPYCTYFHTEAAKLGGASEQEIQEAIAMAAITRQWSTILNGALTDEAKFRAEADQIFAHVKKAADSGAAPPKAEPVTDAASAYKDMEKTFGLVPSFMRRFPQSGIAGAWKEFKAIQLNPNTALPGKIKELIGLGVAAQIPCRYCIHFHTEAAAMNGATPQEVDEALAMAATTRHWSTVLNGSQQDPSAFRKEADGIIRFVKVQMEQTASTK
jgi:AhpD family alkylhydroperoxidase